VLNAVNDALSGTGASFDHIPVLPAEVCAALAGAGAGGALAGTGAADALDNAAASVTGEDAA
jgi:hypothetical protein